MMKSRRIFNINQCFAFAFMVFAVLSSVSDNANEANTASSADWNLAYFMDVNHLFMQNSAKLTAQVFANKLNDFNSIKLQDNIYYELKYLYYGL